MKALEAASSPPIMMERVAFFAPIGPPETGPSSRATPTAASAAAMRRVASGEIVLMSR